MWACFQPIISGQMVTNKTEATIRWGPVTFFPSQTQRCLLLPVPCEPLPQLPCQGGFPWDLSLIGL